MLKNLYTYMYISCLKNLTLQTELRAYKMAFNNLIFIILPKTIYA
jgi:hypothetical protein